MKKINLIPFLLLIMFISCNKESDEIFITKPEINGLVQKGPFLNGTSIGIYELDNNLAQTGKIFSSQILDNTGAFQLLQVSLVSKYLLLKADGYYFNEITNQNSNSTLTLYALSDITDRSTININILSHLVKSRIEQLLKDGLSFSEANTQAKKEVLAIFSIQKSDISDFHLLDISKEGEDNAILLAISLIVQGYRTESELSDLLANIITDIRLDGVLNSNTLGSLLVNDARLFDLAAIRNNIMERYENIGMTITVPNFEKYIQQFLDSASYQISNSIVYPEFSNYGENVLYGDKTSFSSGLSLAANLPKGTSLKIIIKNGGWWFQTLPNGPINWAVTRYDTINKQQIFTAIESGKNCDLIIEFEAGPHIVDYYENNSTLPTRTKTLFFTDSLYKKTDLIKQVYLP